MQNYVITHYVKAAFAGDHSDGTVQVADTLNFWPGATAYIGSTTHTPVEVLILEVVSTTLMRVRLNDSAASAAFGPVAVPTPKAGSDFSAYTVADGAYILQPQDQYIFSYTHDGVVPRNPSALQNPLASWGQ